MRKSIKITVILSGFLTCGVLPTVNASPTANLPSPQNVNEKGAALAGAVADSNVYLQKFESQISTNNEIATLKQEIEIEKLKLELLELRKESGMHYAAAPTVPAAREESNVDVQTHSCPDVAFKLRTGSKGTSVMIGYLDQGLTKIVPSGTVVDGCILK